jgi:hypothetical protein
MSSATGRRDGGGIFAWFTGLVSPVNPTSIPARFISRSGHVLTDPEDLALPVPAGVERLTPLDTGFAGVYRQSRDGFPDRQLVRLFDAAANPLGAAKAFDLVGQDYRRQVVGLANGNVLIIERTSADGIVFVYRGQAYSKAWEKIGERVSVIRDGHQTETQTYAEMPDGGLLVGRTYLVSVGNYEHSVTRFDAALKRVGPHFVFPSTGFDSSFAVGVLNATAGVILYKNGSAAAEPGLRLRKLKL